MINAVILGNSGYTGEELFRLLSEKSDVKIVRSFTGEKIRAMEKLSDNVPNNTDVVFSCLPAEPTMKIVEQLLDLGMRVIDLSGAHRLKKAALYPEYYGFEHLYPQNLKKAVYGFPEKNKYAIKNAQLIAVPGCYARAVHLGLLPLLSSNPLTRNFKIVIKAISGYTGAGKDYIKKTVSLKKLLRIGADVNINTYLKLNKNTDCRKTYVFILI